MKRTETVPFTETETETKKGTNPLPPRGMGSFRTLPREMRQLAAETYALWRELATDRANPYSDHSACLLAGRMAVEATRWEDGLVILAAIRSRMDEKSSPRRIPEWARLHGSTERSRAHDIRKAADLRDRGTIVEHEGTLYLGHVPEVEGSACVKCGGDLRAHTLARRPALRHIGTLLPGLPAAPTTEGELAHLSKSIPERADHA